jgi:hypothetical protein
LANPEFRSKAHGVAVARLSARTGAPPIDAPSCRRACATAGGALHDARPGAERRPGHGKPDAGLAGRLRAACRLRGC